MKRFIFAVSCLYVFTPLFADLPTRSQTHKWGLQFKIDENLSFQDLQGMMMSGQYFFKPQFGIRFGIDGNIGMSTKTHDSSSLESKIENWKISLTSQAIWIYGHKRAFFYWGVGPFLTKAKEQGTKTIPSGMQQGQSYWSRQKSLLLGINLIAGAEYFIADDISLLLEYGLVAGQEHQNLDFPDQSEFRSFVAVVEPQSLKFGVSVYF